MTWSIRLALFVLTVVVLPATFVHTLTSWAGEEGWNPCGSGEVLFRESQRREKMEQDDEVISSCLDQKYETIQELLAGRLSLVEAARQFHECEVRRDERLGKETPPLDASREAALAGRVVHWLRANGNATSEDRARVRVLEAEYLVQFNGVGTQTQTSG